MSKNTSKNRISNIAVLGLGAVGELAATLLHDTGFKVTGVDTQFPDRKLPFATAKASASERAELTAVLKGQDAVLSCLPYHLNMDVARLACDLGLYYFDLTEDVPTKELILELSETSDKLMAPQCGLAPGFVGIVGANLAERFEEIRSIKLRVGALPQHPTGLLAYSFNWSPEGVVNEYLNDCEVIEDGEQKWTSPMEWVETVYVNGVRLEAFTTSGGLGTMCDTYQGRIENLDYKTMRYPGHARLMNFFFHELLMREDRELAGRILKNAKPPVDEDVVHIHVSAEGLQDGRLGRSEFVRSYYPQEIGGRFWRAIAWTTSSSVCAVIEMVNNGTLPGSGFLRQENVPLDAFFATDNGQRYAD
ncbi:MAG: saccharopine dehydrogenase NADP-binding domain-containing protein [Gammaproteobacteria bacterium]|nr:saccharopine dehydrogenase NADP-binding domain-containing protein [Gammaproteobacteria bacterium]